MAGVDWRRALAAGGVDWRRELAQGAVADASVANVTAGDQTRTLAQWLTLSRFPLFDVQDRLDANPNGSADTNAKIQEAIDIVSDAGGGGVFLRPGVWLQDDLQGASTILIPRSGVYVFGVPGKTILRAAPGIDGHMWSMNGISDAGLQDVVLDGDGENQALGHLIRIEDCERIFVARVQLHRAKDYAFGVQGQTVKWSSFYDILAKDCWQDAFDIKDKGNGSVGNHFDMLKADTWGLDGQNGKTAFDFRGPVQVGKCFARGAFNEQSKALRLRQGTDEDPNGRGAHYCQVESLWAENTGTRNTFSGGVEVSASYAQVGQVTARNLHYGVVFGAEAVDSHVQHVIGEGCAYTVSNGGTRCSVGGGKSLNAATAAIIHETGAVEPEISNFDARTSLGNVAALVDNCATSVISDCRGVQNRGSYGYASGQRIGPSFTGNDATLLLVENTIYICPVELLDDFLASHFGFHVTTGAGDAECQVRCALYKPVGKGGKLVEDYGTHSLGTNTGERTIAFSPNKNIGIGLKLLAIIANRNGGATGTMPTLASHAASSSVIRGRLGSGNSQHSATSYSLSGRALVTVSSWGSYTLPSTLPSLTYDNTGIPNLSLRVA
jgi:hypothetical protein